MYVYIGIYAVLVFFGLVVRDRRATPYLLLAGVFLLWFMGARYYVGCDFRGYLHRFAFEAFYQDVWTLISHPEPGFNLLVAAIKHAGLGYVWLNVAASAIMVGVWCKPV